MCGKQEDVATSLLRSHGAVVLNSPVDDSSSFYVFVLTAADILRSYLVAADPSRLTFGMEKRRVKAPKKLARAAPLAAATRAPMMRRSAPVNPVAGLKGKN